MAALFSHGIILRKWYFPCPFIGADCFSETNGCVQTFWSMSLVLQCWKHHSQSDRVPVLMGPSSSSGDRHMKAHAVCWVLCTLRAWACYLRPYPRPLVKIQGHSLDMQSMCLCGLWLLCKLQLNPRLNFNTRTLMSHSLAILRNEYMLRAWHSHWATFLQFFYPVTCFYHCGPQHTSFHSGEQSSIPHINQKQETETTSDF